jgi:SAM-dependent methyltransferase
LLGWLASVPPPERDAAIEDYLGIGHPAAPSAPPGEQFVGYHASGVASIVRMLVEVPVVEDDVVVDLGAGLGKVALLARMLTGATVRGVEVQESLVRRAREAAARLEVDVTFTHGDARSAALDDATVFFLYLPFTGRVLSEVLGRLRAVASRRGIVVCALGVDLEHEAPWLRRRPVDSFWLAIYDSAEPGVTPRPTRASLPLTGRAAEAIAYERPCE